MLFAVCCWLLAGAGEPAVDANAGRPASTLADSLFQGGQYYEAATEYERLRFRPTRDTSARPAQLRLVQTYARAGELNRAEALLADLPALGDSAEWAARSDLAQSYVKQKDYGNARAEFFNLLTVTRDSARRAELHRESGWLSVEVGDFGQAADEFALAEDPVLTAECRKLARLPSRNPGLGMLASTILPGSGELYAGNVRLGLSSLAVNAAVVAGVIYCVDRKLYLDAALLTTLFFGRFYSGSRSNAWDLAKDFNERVHQDAARDLKRRYGKRADRR